jgi:putative endopeptidase
MVTRPSLLLAGSAFAMTLAFAPLASAATAPPAAVRPQTGSFGFDERGMDRAVAPGDDFYAFANGTWAKTTPIPSDRANYGVPAMLDDLSKTRTHAILDRAARDPKSRIGAAYATYLDTATIESRGLAPLKPWLTRIKGTKSRADYIGLLADANRFSAVVGQDDKSPDVYAITMRQSGLGLPDRDYYLSADPKLAKTKADYQAYLARLLTLAGEGDADARAKAIVDLETQIAEASWTRIESRNADKTYNKMTLAELSVLAPGFDFAAFLKGVGAHVDSVIVGQPSAFTGIARIVAAAPIGVLSDQLLVRSLDSFAAVLPRKIDQESFAFNGTTLSGTPEQEVRWKRAVAFTTESLSDDVGKLYVARYFPPATKAAADLLVRNIIAAMDARIQKLEWMAPETKVRARAKLAAFTPKIGYPSRWKDYSTLKIVRGDALGNVQRARRWEHDYQFAKLGKPIYRWEWQMTPMEVNAYADPGMVEIVFPAAILQPPFFDPHADPAVNYGAIGSVIGHEMSHHFDDQGAKYDEHGRLTTWWTASDTERFTALTGKLVKQYDAYEPLPGKHLQGALTLGENMADLAGLSVAIDAYHKTLGGKPAPVIDGFTGDQRFYLGFAQVWRRNYREENLRQRLLTDPHSPSIQRAWIVRNIQPWYDAFKPAPGAKMYLEPNDRVIVW